MIDELTERKVEFLLEFQRATSDRIFPTLRVISLTIDQKTPDAFFYYDGAISEEDLESVSLMITYFGVNFSDGLRDMSWEYTRVDYPHPILHIPGECVYARKENPPLVVPKRGVLIEPWMDRWSKIALALQRALLNNVFPQIRKISVDYTDTTATIHAIVDGPISRDDERSLELVKHYFSMQFPAEEMVQCELIVTQIDAPQPMPGYTVLGYLRKETLNYPNKPTQC